MSKVDSYNSLILEELARAVNRELPLENALVTITYVDCAPDLKQAKIGFSVLPDHLAGTILRKLSTTTPRLVAILKTKLRLRKIPRLIWEFDSTEKEAQKIEQLLAS